MIVLIIITEKVLIVIITAFHENAQINDSDGGNSHNNIMFRTGKVNPAGGATEQCKIDP